jgi:hypothetical protein
LFFKLFISLLLFQVYEKFTKLAEHSNKLDRFRTIRDYLILNKNRLLKPAKSSRSNEDEKKEKRRERQVRIPPKPLITDPITPPGKLMRDHSNLGKLRGLSSQDFSHTSDYKLDNSTR